MESPLLTGRVCIPEQTQEQNLQTELIVCVRNTDADRLGRLQRFISMDPNFYK